MGNFETQIQSSMQDWENKWERKFDWFHTSNLWNIASNASNAIDDCINVELWSIEEALKGILVLLSALYNNDLHHQKWQIQELQGEHWKVTQTLHHLILPDKK